MIRGWSEFNLRFSKEGANDADLCLPTVPGFDYTTEPKSDAYSQTDVQKEFPAAHHPVITRVFRRLTELVLANQFTASLQIAPIEHLILLIEIYLRLKHIFLLNAGAWELSFGAAR